MVLFVIALLTLVFLVFFNDCFGVLEFSPLFSNQSKALMYLDGVVICQKLHSFISVSLPTSDELFPSSSSFSFHSLFYNKIKKKIGNFYVTIKPWFIWILDNVGQANLNDNILLPGCLSLLQTCQKLWQALKKKKTIPFRLGVCNSGVIFSSFILHWHFEALRKNSFKKGLFQIVKWDSAALVGFQLIRKQNQMAKLKKPLTHSC